MKMDKKTINHSKLVSQYSLSNITTNNYSTTRQERRQQQRNNIRDKRNRKKDWVKNKNSSSFMIENFEKEISKPTSVDIVNENKVRLYHFTHPVYVKSVLQNGLERGYVWMEEASGNGVDVSDVICVPCMTTNSTGSNNGQSNLTENNDKELVRFSFLVDKDDPKLKAYPLWFWNELIEYGYDPASAHTYYQQHKRTGNNNIQDWFVYLDIVRPEMIESVYLKSNVDGKYYESKKLQTWSWSGLRFDDLPDAGVVKPVMCSKYNIHKDYTGYLENNKPADMSMVSRENILGFG